MLEGLSFNQIWQKYNQYLKDKELFEVSSGILMPIRAVVINDNRFRSKNMGVMDLLLDVYNEDTLGKNNNARRRFTDKEEAQYFAQRSRPIGYLAAVVNVDTIRLAFSLCAWRDIEKFDSDYGKMLVIQRTLRKLDLDSPVSANAQGNGCIADLITMAKAYASAWVPERNDSLPFVIFDVDNRIITQVYKFIHRCKAYYKDNAAFQKEASEMMEDIRVIYSKQVPEGHIVNTEEASCE